MMRKSSKAWIIAVVIVAMLVLVFAMVGCTGDGDVDKPDKPIDTAEALSKVITAADATLGKIKNSNDTVSLGLTVGVKGENLKLNINEPQKGVNVNINDVNFDAKVKVGANLSKTTDNNEILAEIMVGNAVKFGVYSKDNVVYVQDGVTTTSTKKIKVSGAQAVGYNQYLDDMPGILQNALKNLDLSGIGGMITNFKSLINGLITTTSTADGYTFDIVFVSKDSNAGLAPILKQFGSSLKFGDPFDDIISTYLPYILGGNFDDFSNGTVTTTSKITLDVGIKDNMLTGLKINIDLDPLKSIKDVGGKISIEIGNLVIDNKKTNILPSDLDSYQEGAVTANLALDIPGSPKSKDGLQLFAKIEFSPSLKDEDLKLSVVAKDKDGKEVELEGGYVNLGDDKNPEYAVVFDIGYLYEVAGMKDQIPATGTKYKFSLNIDGNNVGLGDFLKNLIQSQRVFVFFDEDYPDWQNSYYKAEFFKKNGDSFTAKDLAEITPKVQEYYVAEFGGEADDYVVEYRFSDGTLALDKDGKGDLTKKQAELGYNLELTAIVTLATAEHGSTYTSEYVKVTLTNGTSAGKEEVYVRTGVTDKLAEYAPEYTVADGQNFVGWQVGDEENKDNWLPNLGRVEILEDTTVTFKTENVSSKQKVVFKQYNMDTAKYDDDAYATVYFDKWNPNGFDNKAKNGFTISDDDLKYLPKVPKIYGMEGKWVVISDQSYQAFVDKGKENKGYYTPQVIDMENSGNYSAVLDKGTATVYPVYELADNAAEMWTTQFTVGQLEDRFVRQTLNDGVITSVVEAGDPSRVGQGALNSILGNLGDIFGIIKNMSVDANFVAKIMGYISPYLGSTQLIADRIFVAAGVKYDTVKYPYALPTLKNGDKTVDDTSVAAIDDDFLAMKKQSGDIVSLALNRCQNATIYATYQRFVGIYGNLTDTEVDKLFWDEKPDEKTPNKDKYFAAKTAEARAELYVEFEESSYSRKVEDAQKKFDAGKAEKQQTILDLIAAVIGEDALGEAETVEEFIFGVGGKNPLSVALEFAEPTETTGYGVTVKLMRGKTVIASISGDVFFSYAKDIPEIDPDDYKDALSIHEVANEGDELSIVVAELKKIGEAMIGNSGDTSGDGDAE